LGLALSIAACASQAKVQDQPLLNQLMAPNGFVSQQPVLSAVRNPVHGCFTSFSMTSAVAFCTLFL
jgi:hypothetical protein